MFWRNFPEDQSDRFFCNIVNYLQEIMVSQSRRHIPQVNVFPLLHIESVYLTSYAYVKKIFLSI